MAIGAAAALALAGCASGRQRCGADVEAPTPARDPRLARRHRHAAGGPRLPEGDLREGEPRHRRSSSRSRAWGGLVDKLTTSLSGSDSPDVVEVGNTQAAAFTSAGAFLDLTDEYDELGGDDLLPGFVEAGIVRRQVLRRSVLLGCARRVLQHGRSTRSAGLSVPTTLDEYIANGDGARRRRTPASSGI